MNESVPNISCPNQEVFDFFYQISRNKALPGIMPASTYECETLNLIRAFEN